MVPTLSMATSSSPRAMPDIRGTKIVPKMTSSTDAMITSISVKPCRTAG
jgi:hypothetical protein